ncbi:MAG: ribosomal protein S18-alanine N-acetyltransferase [Clostridiales bacterium]|nr:ribosomal protein S18-alanine N-acetyltransferase [Clostridiales bacterium]
MSARFRAATAADAAQIASMMERYVDCPWTEAQVKAEIENENALFFVADLGGKTIGFLSGVCAADECEISDIAVEDQYRRRKIGTSLFNLLLSGARARGVRSTFLLVRADNTPAKNLYEKLGFNAVGERKGYYNGTDAVIMRREI